MMNYFQTADQRIVQLEEEIEELIEQKDKMNPETYAAEYRSILEDLYHAKIYGNFKIKQVIGQSIST